MMATMATNNGSLPKALRSAPQPKSYTMNEVRQKSEAGDDGIQQGVWPLPLLQDDEPNELWVRACAANSERSGREELANRLVVLCAHAQLRLLASGKGPRAALAQAREEAPGDHRVVRGVRKPRTKALAQLTG